MRGRGESTRVGKNAQPFQKSIQFFDAHGWKGCLFHPRVAFFFLGWAFLTSDISINIIVWCNQGGWYLDLIRFLSKVGYESCSKLIDLCGKQCDACITQKLKI